MLRAERPVKPRLAAAFLILFVMASCSIDLGKRDYIAVKTPSPTASPTPSPSPSAIPSASPTPPFTGLAGVVSTYPSAGSTFGFTRAVATDGTNVYVGSDGSHKVYKIVIATGAISVLAGSGTAGSTDATGTAASFNGLNGLATDGTNLYVADSVNNKIRQIVINGVNSGKVTTLAGSGTAGSTDATGAAASFNNPSGVATDGTYVYVAEQTNNLVRRIAIGTGVVTTLASPTGGYGTLTGIATDGTNVYVADFGYGKIWRISGGVASSFATGFTQPDGLTTDGTYVYVSDTGNECIRQVVIGSGAVSFLAGSGTGYKGPAVDGTGNAVVFQDPYQLAVSSSRPSMLFIADSYNSAIRLMQ